MQSVKNIVVQLYDLLFFHCLQYQINREPQTQVYPFIHIFTAINKQNLDRDISSTAKNQTNLMMGSMETFVTDRHHKLWLTLESTLAASSKHLSHALTTWLSVGEEFVKSLFILIHTSTCEQLLLYRYSLLYLLQCLKPNWKTWGRQLQSWKRGLNC